MSRNTSHGKKQNLYAAKRGELIAQMEKTIQIQDKAIRNMEELLEQKDSYISLLESQLEEVRALARAMAQELDSPT